MVKEGANGFPPLSPQSHNDPNSLTFTYTLLHNNYPTSHIVRLFIYWIFYCDRG